MTRRRSLAGTRDAYVPCACGHARIRHLLSGLGSCVQAGPFALPDSASGTATSSGRCICTAFTPKEK